MCQNCLLVTAGSHGKYPEIAVRRRDYYMSGGVPGLDFQKRKIDTERVDKNQGS